jgi:septum formation topological specificity factor MinE
LVREKLKAKDSIKETKRLLENINPHFSYQDKPSIVDIELHIAQNDKDNMAFIQKQKAIFKDIINKYSDIKLDIIECSTEEINNLQTLHIQFNINTEKQTTKITNRQKNKAEKFALDYIIYQELFQIAIIIYNNKIKAENNQ